MKLDFIIAFEGSYNYIALTGILDGIFDQAVPREVNHVSKGENTILLFSKISVKDFDEMIIDRQLRVKLKDWDISNLVTKYKLYEIGIWSTIRVPVTLIITGFTIVGSIASVLDFSKILQP